MHDDSLFTKKTQTVQKENNYIKTYKLFGFIPFFKKYKESGNNEFLEKAKNYASIYTCMDECTDETIDNINNVLTSISKKKKICFDV